MQWKTCDSVLCVRGAKRNLIHTSLTCCALKRLLSLRRARLQRETGGRHAFRPKCLRLLSSGVSLREAERVLKNCNLTTRQMSIVNGEMDKSSLEL